MEILQTIRKLLKAGTGNLTLNTILVYYDYYLKYDYHIKAGASIMEAYEWSAIDCYTSSKTIMRAVKLIDKIKAINI